MEHWKQSYDCNQTFINESNFSSKESIKSWYAVTQINQTKPWLMVLLSQLAILSWVID